MKYMGSKRRIAKYILPIMLEKAKENNITIWVEPFVGGANVIDKVPSDFKRIGSDVQEYVISLYKDLQKGFIPPKEVAYEFFIEVKNNKSKYSKSLVGYLGTQLTFGCEWWGSFRRDNTGKRKYDLEAYNNILKQIPFIQDVSFYNLNYYDLKIPKNSLIYCDPPYINSRKYVGSKDKFNHEKFYDWCREMKQQGHTIFISEYDMPSDFICVWSKEIPSNANNSIKNGQGKKAVEKLFTL